MHEQLRTKIPPLLLLSSGTVPKHQGVVFLFLMRRLTIRKCSENVLSREALRIREEKIAALLLQRVSPGALFVLGTVLGVE